MYDEVKAFQAVLDASHALNDARTKVADTVSVNEHNLRWMIEELEHQRNDGETDYDFSGGIQALEDILKSLSAVRAATNNYLDASRVYHNR